ncbi:glycosyltransferase family 15 protein [Bipolaris zeicola 26-R-13]|uniref:Glycosyltransferase family 15 protein n=1 Tax=Cochliobolus carbonum (strain 26-R-13) TaxID=930089 RepID=W6Y4D2_COCC2|nr:glycosyltransferase family 15 protein [Bipolaris zeicola 26-R-13]EUC34592.1 glycosyltransferase family 15 protein [Bipolaris zeicola 26-R-13]
MAGSQRYIRYIVFAVIALFLLYFIGSSSSVPATNWPAYQDAKTPATPPQGNAAVVDDDETPRASTPSTGAHTNPGTSLNDKTLPPATIAGDRMNATFVTLARNQDVWEIAKSIRHVEDRFNRKFNYDWVFLNDDDFSDEFKKVTTALVSGKTKYGKIPKEHWSFPEWIDQDKAAKVRQEMKEKKIIYGDSISYRHMCRYESGFFFRHPLMLDYEWYWRVEPSIELYCDINYDTFKYMAEHKKKYSFTLSLYEYVETIPTLWDATKNFTKHFPQHISKDNSMKFLSDDGGETYNHCHFWSNFEIGNLNWLRSDAYIDFFTSLDHAGGFFYERWGDAPVHSIAAGLLLQKDELHFFNDIAYYHVPFTHCPTGEKYRLDHKCSCNPKDNFDWKGYSCTSRFYELNGLEKPAGYEKEQD